MPHFSNHSWLLFTNQITMFLITLILMSYFNKMNYNKITKVKLKIQMYNIF